MSNRIFSAMIALALICGSAWGQIKVLNGGGASLEDLIREKALVTIMLKPNAPDPNLTITDVNNTTVTFVGPDGRHGAYSIDSVQSIRVQEKRVATKKSVLAQGALSSDEQAVVDRALSRVTELFQSEPNREVKMVAATVAAAMGDGDALIYLQAHAQGNNVAARVQAANYLYLLGEEIDADILSEGFLHGNRDIRSLTAILAGLAKNDEHLKEIREMSDDPSVEVYPSAIRALARLGDRSSIPKMYDGLSALRQPKTEAAIYGLIQLGDAEIIQEVKNRLKTASTSEWFRLVRILYELEDEVGIEMMKEEALESFAHEKAAGLLLGEDDDWDGLIWIREYFDRQTDPDLANLLFRAELASALYGTAQAQAKIELQKLMRMTETQVFAKGYNSDTEYKRSILNAVHIRVCKILGTKGDKTMLSLLYTPMESQEVLVSLAACHAIAMTANPQYRERQIEVSEYTGERELMLPDIFK